MGAYVKKIKLGGFNGLESSDIKILESRIFKRNDPTLVNGAFGRVVGV